MGIEKNFPKVDENFEQIEELNNRQEQMLVFLNHVTGSNHPITPEGYNEVGRSEGIVNLLAPNEEIKKALRNMFASISRTKA